LSTSLLSNINNLWYCPPFPPRSSFPSFTTPSFPLRSPLLSCKNRGMDCRLNPLYIILLPSLGHDSLSSMMSSPSFLGISPFPLISCFPPPLPSSLLFYTAPSLFLVLAGKNKSLFEGDFPGLLPFWLMNPFPVSSFSPAFLLKLTSPPKYLFLHPCFFLALFVCV